jgi:hypothetical protein
VVVLIGLAFVTLSCDVVDLPQTGSVPDNGEGVQKLAGRTAVISAQTFAQAVVVILPAKDLQAIFEYGLPAPVCPSLGVELGSNTIGLTLEYGTGCPPTAFPLSSLEGTVEGTSYIVFNAFDFELEDVAVDGSSLSGSIAGGFTLAAETTSFTLTVTLFLSDGTKVAGSGSVRLDNQAGRITIEDADLTVVYPGGGSYAIVLRKVVCDPANSGRFVPTGGEATVVLEEDDQEPGERPFSLTFTNQTPIDGTVAIQPGS